MPAESGYYPPGAEFDKRAPWNQREPDEEGKDGCPNPSRRCKCDECQDAMADLDDDR